MHVFITGSEGFVGKELSAACRAGGRTVTCTDLVDKDESSYHCIDITDSAIGDVIPEHADAVVHLAGLTRDPDCRDNGYSCFNANVMGTLNLMDAAYARGVKQFIFASTEWVYDSFAEGEVKTEESRIDIQKLKSEYALSKLVSEQNLRQKYSHGFCDTTILRFGIIYGARQNNWSAVESLLRAVYTEPEVQIGSRQTGRCFIHVSDIVSGILASLGIPGWNLINLQGDRLITLGEIIDESISITGRSPEVVESNSSQISVRNVSNARAKHVLGWKPKFDLRNGLQSLVGTVIPNQPVTAKKK